MIIALASPNIASNLDEGLDKVMAMRKDRWTGAHQVVCSFNLDAKCY